ncbi:zinc transporter ZIP1-like [Onthophagus taurus]|uniref:zinc transporter ZIP1-like n=1 Tax=Onthophagus taurus TaxID=166361 RepID=UPI000C20BEDA|nr:zinc transporter ZIP1-like [Onthophagus taurus]
MATAIEKELKHFLLKAEHIHDDEENESPVVAKVVAMIVLFIASLTLGLLPMQLSRWLKWKNNPQSNIYVNLLLCFGGGVLLCTTFLHLQPEVGEGISELQAAGSLPEFRFHFAEVLMLIGFFTMYLVEEMVHTYLNAKNKKCEMRALSRTHSIRRGIKNESTSLSTSELVKKMEEASKEDHRDFTHDHSHVGHSHVIIEDGVVRSIRGLLVVLALSIHELFEGLAVGLESSPSSVWYMLGAVSAHKLVIAFCIGVELITIDTKKALAVIYVFTFAIVSPLGIGIGILVSDGETAAVPSVILQGLASGTLLYIVFFEIIQRDKSGGLKQFFAILIGFCVMFTLTVLTAHSHSHGEHDHHDHEDHVH